MAQRVINLLETLLLDEIEGILRRYPDTCNCEQCQLDVYTLALNGLPPVYVTGKRFNNELRKTAQTKYLGQMHEAIRKAAAKVRENPRPECNRKMGFWVSADAPEEKKVQFPGHIEVAQTVEVVDTAAPVKPVINAAAKYSQYKPTLGSKRRY